MRPAPAFRPQRRRLPVPALGSRRTSLWPPSFRKSCFEASSPEDPCPEESFSEESFSNERF
jgi:hypothetical protein